METLLRRTWKTEGLVAGLLLLALALVACGAVEEDPVPAVPATATRPAAARAAPSPTATATAPAELPETIPIALPSPTPGPRILSVRQDSYRPGELVEFTITNPLSRTIYYTYGCWWQRPVRGFYRLLPAVYHQIAHSGDRHSRPLCLSTIRTWAAAPSPELSRLDRCKGDTI